MESFLRKITPVLREKPFKVQLAVDRQWEKAWKIDMDRFDYTYDQIRGFLEGAPQTVAIELFYKTVEDHDIYFGLQYHPALKGPKDPFELIATYFQTLSGLEDRSLQGVASRLGKALLDNPLNFLFDEPTSVVMGVVDWWMTFGPCEIWKKGDPRKLSLEGLRQKLRGHENLVSNERNYTGLEFVYEVVPRYWISFQVSEKEKGMFHLNHQRALQLFHEYLVSENEAIEERMPYAPRTPTNHEN